MSANRRPSILRVALLGAGILGACWPLLAACSAGGRAAQAAATRAEPWVEVPASSRPAPGPFPAVPPIEFEPGELPAPPTPIARDGAVVGRLTQQGQLATLTFDAEAGELALFELTAYGYARGWDATSELVVRDAGGVELARQSRAGGALFGDLLVFQAPQGGAYSLDVVAAVHHFRYLVVRHGAYRAAAEGEAFGLRGAADEVGHAYTSGQGSAQRFVVHAAPGSVVALRAEPTTERGWKAKRDLRARAAALAAGLVDPRRVAEQLDPRIPVDTTFPDLGLTVADAARRDVPLGAALLAGGGFSALVRVPASGSLAVVVTQSSAGPGALFDLTVERGLALEPCVVRVGDADDEPLAGVEVVLLREPALERFGRALTGPDGSATFEAPAGPYTVVHRAPRSGPEVVRTALSAAAPVNLVAAR